MYQDGNTVIFDQFENCFFEQKKKFSPFAFWAPTFREPTLPTWVHSVKTFLNGSANDSGYPLLHTSCDYDAAWWYFSPTPGGKAWFERTSLAGQHSCAILCATFRSNSCVTLNYMMILLLYWFPLLSTRFDLKLVYSDLFDFPKLSLQSQPHHTITGLWCGFFSHLGPLTRSRRWSAECSR